jgi:hypothetical protein
MKMKALPLLMTLILAGAGLARSDEVDDILSLKAKNANRLQRFSAEFVVKTHQPKSLKNPKTVTMRYRMKMERIPKAELKTAHQPWRIETEVLEPLPMKLKVEGEQAWFQDQHGAWVELPMTPELREQFLGMSERYRGADPKVQRDKFAMKVLRHNSSIFGPRTRTVESIPKGRARLYARMEEDINDDGLPLETRIYDDSGKQTVKVRVRKHHRVKGVPVVDEMESEAETPAGMVTSETSCSQASLEIEP